MKEINSRAFKCSILNIPGETWLLVRGRLVGDEMALARRHGPEVRMEVVAEPDD
jgi:hypothetical protein